MARLARAMYYGDDLPDDEDEAGEEVDTGDDDTSEDANGAGEYSDTDAGVQEPLPWHGDPGKGASERRRRTGGTRRRSRTKKRTKRTNPSHLAILRLDVEALRRGCSEGDELCEIAGVGPVSVDAARDLLGDSILKLVLTKGTAVANVVSLGRGPTAAQRVALQWAQPECSVAGCCHTFTQVDHRRDWHLCHETALDNLDRLCPHHHSLKTREGWVLVAGTGKRPMVPPDDPATPAQQPERRASTRTAAPPDEVPAAGTHHHRSPPHPCPSRNPTSAA